MTADARLREALADGERDQLVYDLTGIEGRYDRLTRELPGVDVRFAMKACPVDGVLGALAARGAGCDAASPNEVEQALRVGVPVHRVHYGNTCKSDQSIAAAYRLGVRDFATDSVEDVAGIAAHAPGARVFCRLATSGEGALWGLSRKFGCSALDAVRVLEQARASGLEPAGLSVHVGSQQMSVEGWQAAFDDLAAVLAELRRRGMRPRLIDLGGGLPALGYLDRRGVELHPPLDAIFAAIRAGMRQLTDAAGHALDFVIEPGRHLVADHGAIRAHVLRLSARELADGDRHHWLYLSVGKFNGLYEIDELRYRMVFPTHAESAERVSAVVAGPTCDSDDAYRARDGLVRVPAALESGDPVWIWSAGAYATSYTTQGFNGFAPLPHRLVRQPRVRHVMDGDWAAVTRLEAAAYAGRGLSEGRPALESKARVSPRTCFVLETDGGVAGYLLALPRPPGDLPELGATSGGAARGAPGDLGETGGRGAPDQLHLHDIVIDEPLRGRGLAQTLLHELWEVAREEKFARVSLVSVAGNEPWWRARGFRPHPRVPVPASYGAHAVYMSRAVEADDLATHP